MKKIHRILTALCAATICFSLPIMASCSTPGSTKPSSGEPTRREMPTESSEDSHGRFPGEPLPLLPEFPEFPGHTEGPEEGKPVHPRPVTPARPANPNNGEEMPSPRRPHGRRPDSINRKRDATAEDELPTTGLEPIRMKTNVREQRTVPAKRISTNKNPIAKKGIRTLLPEKINVRPVVPDGKTKYRKTETDKIPARPNDKIQTRTNFI